ncbi:MAG: CocE/NonD family hydrolase [Gemmatimonadales bacterium]
MRPCLPILGLSILLVGTSSPAASQNARTFDVYTKGIHAAELTVAQAGYTIRKRHPETGAWSSAVTQSSPPATSDTAFSLPGRIRHLAFELADLEVIPWHRSPAVAWPDGNTIYDPHEKKEVVAAGQRVQVTRWTQRDGSLPVDLIVDPAGTIVAAIDVRADVVLVRRGYEGLTTVAAWKAPTVSPARYGYSLAERSMVPMTDGVRLATLVYLPKDAKGPFPTIFVRTPYGISNLILDYWHYVARGYAVVLQSVRGTIHWDTANRSEGVWDPMINEPADGKTSLEWLVKQPWSDGQVCMQGGSYVGYTQWAVSMANNPALKCIVPESSMGTAFSDQPYWGGTIVEGIAYYVLFMLDKQILPGRTWNDILHHRPLIDLDRFATGEDIPQWKRLLSHQSNDTYWAQQNWYRSTDPRRFSALQISGWFDDDFAGTEANWALMARYGQGPQRLVIGPWKHSYNVDRRLNGYSFGPTALREDIWLIKQQWYDRFLRNQPAASAAPNVEYFVLGSNQWRQATAWPPANAVATPWFLKSDGQASRIAGRGGLTPVAPPQSGPTDRYSYDPANPPPNWYDFDQMQRWEDVQSFPYDVKDIESRPDVVTYTSAPLEEDLTIAGNVMLVLHASTDVRDTDWWVHLSDVDTTGRSNRITIGVLRARFRDLEDPVNRALGKNYETERLLSGNPDEVVEYKIALRSIANTFKKGHRVRIAVMNAMNNYSFPNSNTGGDEARATKTVTGRMAIHHGGPHPSRIILPVMPR